MGAPAPGSFTCQCGMEVDWRLHGACCGSLCFQVVVRGATRPLQWADRECGSPGLAGHGYFENRNQQGCCADMLARITPDRINGSAEWFQEWLLTSGQFITEADVTPAVPF
mmetsp:Transcript_8494/g.18867  ORF Transcript_8494/g.18867 Transcript_8494/m.18867 type:complete len:111 (+) Transcript_8494:619-951(+)